MNHVSPQTARPTATPDDFFASLEKRTSSHPALSHSFLRRFASERISLEQLVKFAVQHYLYSRLFTRNLGAVISNVPDEKARSLLIANMYEEIGEPRTGRDRAHLLLLQAGMVSPTDVGLACSAAATAGSRGDVTKELLDRGLVSRAQVTAVVNIDAEQFSELTHPALFRRFLFALGLTPAELADVQAIRETAMFVKEYQSVCRDGDWLVSMGAMGPGTECVVPALYTPIEKGIAGSGLVSDIDYIFWTIHIHCDEGHGANIIEAIKPYAHTLENQSLIAEGAMRVLNARKVWFDGLEKLVFS